MHAAEVAEGRKGGHYQYQTDMIARADRTATTTLYIFAKLRAVSRQMEESQRLTLWRRGQDRVTPPAVYKL